AGPIASTAAQRRARKVWKSVRVACPWSPGRDLPDLCRVAVLCVVSKTRSGSGAPGVLRAGERNLPNDPVGIPAGRPVAVRPHAGTRAVAASGTSAAVLSGRHAADLPENCPVRE